jgi:hypothetical protein
MEFAISPACFDEQQQLIDVRQAKKMRSFINRYDAALI